MVPEDFKNTITYFDLDGDGKLNYHDFLQIILPCDDAYLRAAVTQRPNNEMPRNEFLPMRVERALSQLLFKEARLHLKADIMKRNLENQYDFNILKAFRAVDDWSYSYIDQNNLKRFLRNTGHISTKQELIAILRRFDMDGDAKINFKEFELGMKSTLTIFGGAKKKQRPKSSTNPSQRLTNTASKASIPRSRNQRSVTPTKPSMGTPRIKSAN